MDHLYHHAKLVMDWSLCAVWGEKFDVFYRQLCEVHMLVFWLLRSDFEVCCITLH